MFSKIENKSQWKQFLDKALFRTFFHFPEWEDFLEKEFSWLKFERYLWRDELLLSIARCKFFGKEKLVSHPLCEYGGPLPLKRGIDFANFASDFSEEFGPKARVKFHPHIFQYRNDVIPLSRAGLHRSTFWVENFSKKTSVGLWRSFRKTLRHEIKKGENAGIVVEVCGNEEELERFYDLYVATMKRHKNIPFPRSVVKFLAGFLRRRGEEPISDLFIAKYENRVVGGSAFLFYPPFIHYFINASDYKFRDYSIGHIILWHVMQAYTGRLISQAYDYFDLGGTRKGSALEVFKRGWGSRECPIYEIGQKSVSSGEKSLTRQILGIAPLCAVKRVNRLGLWFKV